MMIEEGFGMRLHPWGFASHRRGQVASATHPIDSSVEGGVAVRPRWLGLTAAILVGAVAFTQPAFAQPAGGPAKPPAAAPAKPEKPLTADQKKAEAKKAFEDGGKKFDAGDFAGAYLEFKKADEFVPGAVPKFRMAEALDKAGDAPGAVKAYQDFLDSNPPKDKHQARIDTATQRIEAIKKTPADVKVNVTPANATLAVDGASQATNPVKVPPGKHEISATAEGFLDGKTDVEVTYGEKKEITLNLTAKPAEVAKNDKPPPPSEKTEPPKKSGSKVPAIITLSLAGAGAIVGGVFGGLALKSKSDFEKTPTQDLYDTTERDALIADMSFGVAITFGVTGVVLLITSGGEDADKDKDKDKEKKAEQPFFTPWAGPTGAGAVGGFTF